MRHPIIAILTVVFFSISGLPQAFADDGSSESPAAGAINKLGIDLLRQMPESENVLLSPYSIQSTLLMSYEGARGATEDEMRKALHYPAVKAALHDSAAELQQSLDDLRKANSPKAIHRARGEQPLSLSSANQLFGEKSYHFVPAFLTFLQEKYHSPLQLVDFRNSAEESRGQINEWVAAQTERKIRNLIPEGQISDITRLVLVNALYFNAAWAEPFSPDATKPVPFFVRGEIRKDLPTMTKRDRFRYSKQAAYSTVVLPYYPEDLEFVILLPEKRDGWAQLQASLTAENLAKAGQADEREVILHLPKFKLEPQLIMLKPALEKLGMKLAFDLGSADFSGIATAAENGGEPLAVSEVLHKAFISLDENGTEAAAATAMLMAGASAGPTTTLPPPVEVFVDHPFLFVIRHRPSGSCLFLGRLVDPS